MSRTAKERRTAVVEVATRALHRAPLHYTEGSRRWDSVKNPFGWGYADCSSFYTSCYKGAALPDPNHEGYGAGYTGTLAQHGARVSRPKRGDAVLYRPPYPYGHVAVYAGDGKVISHGQEGGPFLEAVHYRSDFGEYRRYIFPTKAHYAWALFASSGRVWTGRAGRKLPGWVKTAAKLIKGGKAKRVKVKR